MPTITTNRTYSSQYPSIREREAATVYCRGYDRDISDLGVAAMQSQHRAALTLLGVTFDTFVLERTKLPGVTALRFVAYGRDESGVFVETPVTTTVAPESTQPHPRAIVEYVDKMCNPGRVMIMDEGEFRNRVANEERVMQAKMVEEQLKRSQRLTDKELYGFYKTSGQIPDDMLDALVTSQRYESAVSTSAASTSLKPKKK